MIFGVDCDIDVSFVSLMISEIDDDTGNDGCGPVRRRADNP